MKSFSRVVQLFSLGLVLQKKLLRKKEARADVRRPLLRPIHIDLGTAGSEPSEARCSASRRMEVDELFKKTGVLLCKCTHFGKILQIPKKYMMNRIMSQSVLDGITKCNSCMSNEI